jgi:lipopolysaccharide export system permease protein
LTGITIQKSIGDGSKTAIKAKDGKGQSEQSSILQLVLNDGYYEDLVPNKYEDRIKMPFVKSHTKNIP